jgi:uncharacterized surface protein with fasciclin (FAS1) repeats
MSLKHILTAAAALALITGAAQAQTPADAPAPAAPAAAPSSAPVVPAGDIINTLKTSGQFTTFLNAAAATNLTGLIRDNKNLTVFAPTNAAFSAMPADQLAKLMLPENKADLQKLILYHVVNAPLDSTKFKGKAGPAMTVAGTAVELDGSGPALKVDDANITQADVRATNGLIQVIDKVLTPGGAMAAAAAKQAAEAAAAPPAEETPAPAPAKPKGKATGKHK